MRKIQFILLLVVSFLSNYATIGLEIKLGIYTSDKPTAVVKKVRPVLDEIEVGLSKLMGERVVVRTQVARSYEKGLQDLVSGNVDFSRMGPASYVKSKDANPAISILAVESNGGKNIFQGKIFVREDADILTIRQLRGKRFAFGNQYSTIGRYLSQQYLLNHNITSADLGYYEYLGRHDTVGAAVLSGSFDAGAVKENTFNRIVANGGKLREIASLTLITHPWIASERPSEQIKENLRKVLLEMVSPEALKGLKREGFLPGKDDDYNMIRESIRINHEFFE